MTITTTSSDVAATGDGLSAIFTYPYAFVSTADIKLYLDGVLQSSGYVVTGTPTIGGSGTFPSGTVTITPAPAVDVAILITSEPDLLQTTSLPPNDPLPARVIEKMADKLTLIVQRMFSKVRRAILVPDGETPSNLTLPAASVRAGRALAFDALGGVALADVLPGNAFQFGVSYIDDFVGDGAHTVFPLSANPGSQKNIKVMLGASWQGNGTDYTWSEASPLQITFMTPPPNLVAGQIYYTQALPIGVANLDSTVNSLSAEKVFFDAMAAYSQGVGKAIKDRGVSPCDYPYLAKADDVTDDTAAIIACCAANKHVYFGDASKKYVISAAIPWQDDQVVTGDYAQIRHTVANTPHATHSGAGTVRSRGITYVGLGNYADTDMALESAIRSTGGGHVEVIGNRFINFGYTSVHGIGCASFYFDFNYVQGPGAPALTAITSGKNYGVLADALCKNVYIGAGNRITKHAQGVRIGDRCDTVYIGALQIYDIVGQHGIYGGAGCTNVRVDCASIQRVSLIGCKWQNDDAVPYDARNIKFIGVQVADSGSHGFQFSNGSGSTQKMYGAEMIGCTSLRAGEDAFNLGNVVDGLLNGCVADTPTREGFSWSNCPGLTIVAPKARRFGANGMRDVVASPYVTIIEPDLVDGATANTVGQRFGIFITDCTELTIRGGKIRDANAKMEYGLYLAGGDQTTCTLQDLTVLNATGTGGRFVAASRFRKYEGNSFAGTGGPTTNEPTIPTATIVSNVLTIPQGCKACYVPAGTVTSIAFAGHSGKTIALIFTGITTMTDGSNYRGAGNFVSTADDVLVVTCDGAIYYQCAPGSVN